MDLTIYLKFVFFTRPTVRKLSSIGKLNQAIGDHSDSVFFLFIGEEDENNDFYVSEICLYLLGTNINETSTTPSCSGPIPAKSRG